MKFNDSGLRIRSPRFGLVAPLALSIGLIGASCSSSRWRSPEKGSRTSSLPRVEFALVHDAGPDDHVGVKQIADGEPYAVDEWRFFRVSEAHVVADGLGNQDLSVEVHSDSTSDFEHWTKQNVGHQIGIAVDGQLAWVGELQEPARDRFLIRCPDDWTEVQRTKLYRRLNGYGAEYD